MYPYIHPTEHIFILTDLNRLGRQLTNVIQTASPRISRIFVLTDTHTRAHCLPLLLRASPILKQAVVLEIHPGEEHKDIYSCVGVWRNLAEEGADRYSLLINLGGGVVTDLGGFVASTFKRGIRFVNVPTSLLSMVDASSGGKTGVDLDGLKNEVGLFAFPLLTIVFPPFLKTLSTRHLYSGFAEVIKHALIADTDLWKKINTGYSRLEGHDAKAERFRKMIINRSVAIKQQITGQDPMEEGMRKILNFGHTIGHAIESRSLFSDVPFLHGEAIAMGMLAEAWLSVQLCGLEEADLNRLVNLIKQIYKTQAPPPESWDMLLSLMRHDKKNKDTEFRFSLLTRPGQAVFDIQVDPDLVREALDWLYQTYIISIPEGTL